MEAILRAKFRVSEVLHRKDNKGNTETEILKMQAVTSDNIENKNWSTWTPFGNLELHINNPLAINKVSQGHEFFIDIIPCEIKEGE